MRRREEQHDFIIWLHSIYLDIISNNYSHYLSDMLPGLFQGLKNQAAPVVN